MRIVPPCVGGLAVAFVLDPTLRLLGLQAIPGLPDSNLLVFEHRCGSSVSVLALKLRQLLSAEDQAADRPVLFGTETCSGHCRVIENLATCDRPCANARDRRLAVLIADAKGGDLTCLAEVHHDAEELR